MIKQTLTLLTAAAIGLSPVAHAETPTENDYWWPNRLDLSQLRNHSAESNPMGENFNYAEEFAKLDLDALKRDLETLMTTSQDWWPADYGHYGPFFIRMAWHSAGTYRVTDGRGGAYGGAQRFAPLNSWPDNGNLDKARLLLWPIKQKYGNKISWGDLMVLAGTVAMESMGFRTLGFAGGRVDDWEPEQVNWGTETEWLSDNERYHKDKRELMKPLAAVQMGLIYVNPEGPGGNPDPLAAAQDIRESFGLMAMSDEETLALIAGGHTFGKAHGAHKPDECLGREPEAAPVEEQGMGWMNKCGKGNAEDTITSGLEGAWTSNPSAWTHNYLQNLYGFEWKKTKSPAGATQWVPTNPDAKNLVPDAHLKDKRHAPIMFTTDIALKKDPGFQKITKHWLENPKEFENAFARAWFKLTHRDMGPATRYLGSMVPKETFTWQDNVPAVDYKLISNSEAEKLEELILKSGLTIPELIRTAWASASTYRGTDFRGGANGARVRLAPQKDWEVNQPKELAKVLGKLESIQKDFNKSLQGDKQVSLADVIVIAGNAAVESAAKKRGYDIEVPFSPGRADATQEQTDESSFAFLRPKADGFRNYFTEESYLSPAEALVDKADKLTLTVPEMTALVGGMRSLNANVDGLKHGVFTDKPGTLSNDFFVNLLDLSNKWNKSGTAGIYELKDRKTGKVKWTATPVDLVFGSNSELRAVAEVYAQDDAGEKFVNDFVSAWTKVMELDRFDLKNDYVSVAQQ